MNLVMGMENTIFRFAELRVKKDLKQWQIARMLNVKANTYSKWEKGINDITLEKLNELANFYHVSLDYFVGISENSKEVPKRKINLDLMRKRLRLLRRENHMSQSLLSKKTGFAQTTYSSFETGARTPTAFKLFHLCQFYQVSFDYLTGRTDKKERELKTVVH